ncbi:MAG: tRNA (adenosine(37)-N6)-threonylcarbamoyltransferase complex dimerization subunit type 1 TsaB [Candidatus Kapaibacteriota bacterium]
MKQDLLLSIETSSKVCSVCISQADNILLEYSMTVSNSHDQFLAVFVKRALEDLGLKPADLSALAISSGPGSFTGLRIGSAFAKGFCFDGKIKLVAVPTLFAIAFNCKKNINADFSRVVAVSHSHKDLFFYQFFDHQSNPLSDIAFKSAVELNNILQDSDIVVGIGAETFSVGVKFPILNIISASAIAKAGWELYNQKKFVSPDEFVPSYFFEFQPNIKMK